MSVTTTSIGALAHFLGFVIGIALYAMLLAMVVRRGGERSARWRETMRGQLLPLATGALGLIWNVGGIVVYSIPEFGFGQPSAWGVAAAYAALGFLPAVVVHSVLHRRARHREWPALVVVLASYAMSATALVLHLSAAADGQAPSTAALRLLTWSFLALTLPLIVIARRDARSESALSVVGLSLFAVSALHLSHHRDGTADSWLMQLVGHHASIPVAFAILYADFRFALADVFLKRALTLFAVTALAVTLYVGIQQPLVLGHDDGALAVGALVLLWVGTAVLYPFIRNGATWLVDRVFLRRYDYAAVRERITFVSGRCEQVTDVLEAVARELAPALAATRVHVDSDALADDIGGAVALIPIPTVEAPRFRFSIGELAGGRRLLSDDLQFLESVSLIVARRIDAIRIMQERFDARAREEQIQRLATEAELRALRAQINPHFLFNALNTIQYLVQTSPERAQATLMKLTVLLRAAMRSGSLFVPLDEELKLVRAYLDVEHARFEERLRVSIDVPDELKPLSVPSLVLQPLVENALKHGIGPKREGGEVRIRAALDMETRRLRIAVSDTGNGFAPATDQRERGLGLANVEQRLSKLYDDAATLTVVSQPGVGTTVTIEVPLLEPHAVTAAGINVA